VTETKTIERPEVNEAFGRPADQAAIEHAAEGLRGRGFVVKMARDAAEARDIALGLIPDGAEVGQGASQTLDQIGMTEAIEKSGRYDAIRPRMRAMDRATQMPEIRKLGSAPEYFLGSVQALTEGGEIVVGSKTGSQLGPIVSGAGHVILVVGAQKIVPDLESALRRVREYSYPIEDYRAQEAYGWRSALNKTIVLSGDFPPGRTTVVLVGEPLGV
jgi:hypothetical protein